MADELAEAAITVDVAPDLPVVTGDRARLLEVFHNLIGNAARFIGEPAAPRIEVGARTADPPAGQDGSELVVYVRDNGIGIDPKYHQKIFGLFERLDAQGPSGTGIGLALVKRIVEFHGGRIWVESEGAGHGSAFCFTLPGAGPSAAGRTGYAPA